MKKIAKGLNVDFYFAHPYHSFAHPYHSWQRGSNKSLNGFIGQHIPKKTDFSPLSNAYVQWAEDQLNNRPGKRCDFQTPNQMFDKMTKNEVASGS